MIKDSTHFTETSSSLIDIMLVSNPANILFSGVGDPFLNLDIRYHCPVFGVFKFSKSHSTVFKRQIWKYQEGNYETLKQKFLNTDWDSLKNSNIDIYATNITDHIKTLSYECIPNKIVNIRQMEPPWMHNELRKLMRKRKRAYDKAKRTNHVQHWTSYKKLRNETTSLLRSSKKTISTN